MRKSFRIGGVILLATVMLVLSDPRSALSQRIRGGNQGSAESKDDKNDDDQKEKTGRRGQGKSKDQGQDSKQSDQNSNNLQGTSQNNGQGTSQNDSANRPRNFTRSAGKAAEAKKSSNSNVPSQLRPFIPGGNENDSNNPGVPGQLNRGPGGANNFGRPGQPGFPGNNSGQPIVIGPNGLGVRDGEKNAERWNNERRDFGRWKDDRWEGSRKIDNWTRVFGAKQQPFSAQWYKDHPQAWKYNNDKSNVWVVATVPGIYSWLGWGAVPQQYLVGYSPTVRFDANRYGDWYPLGVYSLMSGGEDMGTRVVQLAVDRRGHIAGNYYDMITNDDKSISGDIDRQTQRVTFWLNRNPNVHFHTSIYRLLQQPYGSITVHLPGAEQRWQFVRLEN